MKKLLFRFLIIATIPVLAGGYLMWERSQRVPENTANLEEWRSAAVAEDPGYFDTAVTKTNKEPEVPPVKVIENNYHVFQSFNNCGPAAMSMTLSYYGINVSQKELGEALRPYQNQKGDNDDKSVTLQEIADKAGDYGLFAYHRPAGNMELIKKFTSRDIPVLVRTWLHEGEDIGHFRVVKGYNDPKGQIIQDDSYQGKNLTYSYADFESLWKAFNHEYLVLVPEAKKEIAETIIGEDMDDNVAWNKAVEESTVALNKDPSSVYDRFNLSVAKYNLGDYKAAVEEFEKVADKLPARMLWYQIEPILAYYELGDYPKVLELTDSVLTSHNRAFSELYQLRGRVYLAQGRTSQAQEEFKKALIYNKNYQLRDDEKALLTSF